MYLFLILYVVIMQQLHHFYSWGGSTHTRTRIDTNELTNKKNLICCLDF